MPRPKKPTALKKQEGTFRKDRAVQNEITPSVKSDFMPPENLNAWGKNLWVQVASEFSNLKMLTVLDDGSLFTMCNEFGVYCECSNLLKTQGLQIEENIYDKEGNVIGTRMENNPLRRIASDAYKNYRAMATEFGLTPASRTKIGTTNVSKGDTFDEF